MAGATTTTLSTLVRPVLADEPTVIKYTNRDFFKALQTAGVSDVRAVGDTAFRWKVLRGTGNSSVEVFTEGQAVPTAGSQSWVEASLAWVYHRAIVQLTGHARDAMGSHYLGEQFAGATQLSGELTGAMAEIDDLMANTFLGSTGSGILNAVEATGTYAGLARGTYTDWAGYEEAGGAGALTVAMLNNTWEALRDNDRGGNVQAILAPWNQITNYQSLVGSGANTSLVRYVANSGAPTMDLGYNATGLSFMNVPIYGVADMTDTEIVFMSDVADNWLFATIRPIEKKELAISDDSVAKVQVSTGGTLVCRNCRTQGKVTNLTA